jgi:hypothetical protein
VFVFFTAFCFFSLYDVSEVRREREREREERSNSTKDSGYWVTKVTRRNTWYFYSLQPGLQQTHQCLCDSLRVAFSFGVVVGVGCLREIVPSAKNPDPLHLLFRFIEKVMYLSYIIVQIHHFFTLENVNTCALEAYIKSINILIFSCKLCIVPFKH